MTELHVRGTDLTPLAKRWQEVLHLANRDQASRMTVWGWQYGVKDALDALFGKGAGEEFEYHVVAWMRQERKEER